MSVERGVQMNKIKRISYFLGWCCDGPSLQGGGRYGMKLKKMLALNSVTGQIE